MRPSWNVFGLAVICFALSCQVKDDGQSTASREAPEGMTWIPGGEFVMGTNEPNAYLHERPAHRVYVDGFWMDETEVTNSDFKKFSDATGYVTIAERKPEWEDLKKQLPVGTPKPPDSILLPGSLKFSPPETPVRLNDYSLWWKWSPETNWKQPEGKGSILDERWHHPVVHIAHEDASAYCHWVNKRLPTEAEWEFASRGGQTSKPFDFANEILTEGRFMANVFQGSFPNHDLGEDGFVSTAPVKTFPPNAYGLYDMIGNVWEWTSDYYDPRYFEQLATNTLTKNPKGPTHSFDPNEPGIVKYVTKGGSYLCATDYCSNYRATARQGTAFDSGQSHIGFRCVR